MSRSYSLLCYTRKPTKRSAICFICSFILICYNLLSVIITVFSGYVLNVGFMFC